MAERHASFPRRPSRPALKKDGPDQAPFMTFGSPEAATTVPMLLPPFRHCDKLIEYGRTRLPMTRFVTGELERLSTSDHQFRQCWRKHRRVF
jgi:hypothetical protein